jgi:hypothetical protein
MAPQPKSLPDSSAPIDFWTDLVTHPEVNRTNYINFEEAGIYPFQSDAVDCSRVNAWWLAEAAFLAYWCDDNQAKRIYRDRAGLELESLSEGGTQCHVAHNDKFALVAFRGTQPDEWTDILDDAHFRLVNWSKGMVHEGFARAFERIRPRLSAVVGQLPPGCRLWFTGHSLGAALATLAADSFDTAAGVYTFGSPLVGDQIFAGHFNARRAGRSFRFVNDHDIVTHVPPETIGLPRGTYTHIADQRWIDKDGNIGTTQPTLLHYVRDVFGTPSLLFHLVRELMAHRFPAIPAALADHAPILYVLHAWNDFARHRDG